MKLTERLERALQDGNMTVLAREEGGLPAGVEGRDLAAMILMVGGDGGFSALELDVLICLVAWTGDSEWRRAKTGPRRRVAAAEIARVCLVDVRSVVEAERSLAAKGWIGFASGTGRGAGSSRVESEMAEIDMRPLMARWETLCAIVLSKLATRQAAARLRSAVAWRSYGLVQTDGEGAVDESGTFAEMSELIGECDRLLLSPERLVAAWPVSAGEGRAQGQAGPGGVLAARMKLDVARDRLLRALDDGLSVSAGHGATRGEGDRAVTPAARPRSSWWRRWWRNG